MIFCAIRGRTYDENVGNILNFGSRWLMEEYLKKSVADFPGEFPEECWIESMGESHGM